MERKGFYILVDDRERHIIDYMAPLADINNIPFYVERLTVGDYAIMWCGKIIAVIERKTWADLSASIKDNRILNMANLLATRERTGCMCMYIIEGTPCPSPTKCYGGIPHKSLRAHLDHVIFRDQVHVIHSLNKEGTAGRLYELVHNMDTLDRSLPMFQIEGGSEILHEKRDKPDNHILYDLWCCMPSITIRTAKLLAPRISILDFITNGIEKDKLAMIQYPSGMMIGKRAGTILRICNTTSETNYRIYIAILASIPGISLATARAIFAGLSYDILRLREIDIEDLANIKKNEKRRVGIVSAAKIQKYFNMVA